MKINHNPQVTPKVNSKPAAAKGPEQEAVKAQEAQPAAVEKLASGDDAIKAYALASVKASDIVSNVAKRTNPGADLHASTLEGLLEFAAIAKGVNA